MVVVTMIIGMLLVLWAGSKLAVNTNPDQTEDQEAVSKKAGMKHQGYQTLDYTEPWSK